MRFHAKKEIRKRIKDCIEENDELKNRVSFDPSNILNPKEFPHVVITDGEEKGEDNLTIGKRSIGSIDTSYSERQLIINVTLLTKINNNNEEFSVDRLELLINESLCKDYERITLNGLIIKNEYAQSFTDSSTLSATKVLIKNMQFLVTYRVLNSDLSKTIR